MLCPRASAQFDVARTTLKAHARRTPRVIAAGGSFTAVCGGLQLFIDIRRAFDSIPRDFFCSLDDIDTPPALASVLKKWHADTHYVQSPVF